jgi:acetyltransferase-like isoleucine patch superfamily enzyme
MRLLVFYIFYLVYKIRNIGKVKFNGFTVVFKFKNSYINFGKNIIINSDFTSNLVGMSQRTVIVARNGGMVKIGDNVGISGSTIYSFKYIEIGENTLIGAGCKILDNDLHPLELKARLIDDKSKVKRSEIIIGKNCFLGSNSIILKGTRLGENCIVGAGSVVKGEYPDNSIIVGNPAKLIKKTKTNSNKFRTDKNIELVI